MLRVDMTSINHPSGFPAGTLPMYGDAAPLGSPESR